MLRYELHFECPKVIKKLMIRNSSFSRYSTYNRYFMLKHFNVLLYFCLKKSVLKCGR